MRHAIVPGQNGSLIVSVETLIVTPDEDGMRLDRWFKQRVPAVTLSHLNKIVRTGQVRVDGGRAKISTRLVEGQAIRVPPFGGAAASLAAPARIRPKGSETDRRDVEAMILFEDRGLIVLNKPYGLAVQGGSGTYHHLDGMLDSFTDEKGDRPRLVHRLDRDTSGVLLVAKTRKMAADLGAVFRSRQAQKIYWALLEGIPKPEQGRISLFLAKGELMGDNRGPKLGRAGGAVDRASQERMRVAKHGEDDAQHSVTYYTIVDKVLPRVAWVSMKPITGRTHQLRAHAEAIGHPIVGDPKYNGGTGPNPRRSDPLRAVPSEVEPKLHLLARRLVLPNPSGGTLDVTAPLPPHMKASWDLFGFDVKQYDPIDDAPE
jgi:23S rRNA pseudouridine955/2504/2580 synthase